MSNPVYATLSRQYGLMQEMQVVANNIANASTTGYKANQAIFAEYLVATGPDQQSLSIGGLAAHNPVLEQGALALTGGSMDLAIQGEGFFVIETAAGPRLTRAGHFQLSAAGELINGDGEAVLNAGGGAIVLPPEGGRIDVAPDGSVSVDGQLFDQIGVVVPNGVLTRHSNTAFDAPDGFAPVEEPHVVQGALEQSNVSPVLEVARMIEVQRAYEAGQELLETEHRRLEQVLAAARPR